MVVRDDDMVDDIKLQDNVHHQVIKDYEKSNYRTIVEDEDN